MVLDNLNSFIYKNKIKIFYFTRNISVILAIKFALKLFALSPSLFFFNLSGSDLIHLSILQREITISTGTNKSQNELS